MAALYGIEGHMNMSPESEPFHYQKRRIKIFLFTITLLFIIAGCGGSSNNGGTTNGSSTGIVLFDNFEYGQNTQNCVETEALSGWNWEDCNDESINPGGVRGYLGISDLHAHTGSRSMLMSFLPDTFQDQTNLFPEMFRNVGNDVWIDMWIYPAYEDGMYSQFDITNKWIYAYPDYPPNYSPGHWCLLFSENRRSVDWVIIESLPDNHTGFFVEFDREGCAQGPPHGQNLDGTYMPVNQWSRLIVHTNSNSAVSPNMEAWIDAGSGLVKVIEYTTTWTYGEGAETTRIKIGTTFPARGQSVNFFDAWIFVDDITITGSRDDIDWGV